MPFKTDTHGLAFKCGDIKITSGAHAHHVIPLSVQGVTVIANKSKDKGLVEWAEKNGYLLEIDRGTPWGNPFKVDDDGTRDEVCDAYRDH